MSNFHTNFCFYPHVLCPLFWNVQQRRCVENHVRNGRKLCWYIIAAYVKYCLYTCDIIGPNTNCIAFPRNLPKKSNRCFRGAKFCVSCSAEMCTRCLISNYVHIHNLCLSIINVYMYYVICICRSIKRAPFVRTIFSVLRSASRWHYCYCLTR